MLVEHTAAFRSIISIIYNKLTQERHSQLPSLKADWEFDLGEIITDDMWLSILQRVRGSSICARHSLMQCKLLHRSHRTNQKLSRHFPNISHVCYQCCSCPTTHTHMFWACSTLNDFWSLIFGAVSDCIGAGITISPCPFMDIFGVSPDHLGLSKTKSDSIAFVTFIARHLILLKWKDHHPPTFTHWTVDVLYFLKLEKIIHYLRGFVNRFFELWNPFISHVKEKIVLPAM